MRSTWDHPDDEDVFVSLQPIPGLPARYQRGTGTATDAIYVYEDRKTLARFEAGDEAGFDALVAQLKAKPTSPKRPPAGRR